MKSAKFLRWVFLVIAAAIVIAVAVNYEWIYDYTRGVMYSPSEDMSRIRDDLDLTDRGRFLFNASQPALQDREDFNEVCRHDNDDENAVLGCYTEGNIYVYNITDEKLDGILELTTAHELLHANWARMSEAEKKELELALGQVLEMNQVILGEEMDTYETSMKQEELYVRAGTEVANLPEVLEKHYATMFNDQDKVVAFYDKYIAVFKALKAEMDELRAKMGELDSTINIATSEYESSLAQYEADVMSFNNCAGIAGCFSSQFEFDTRRAQLISNRMNLEEKYNYINKLIDEYNDLVEKYNDDVVKNDNLNKKINSNAEPEEVE